MNNTKKGISIVLFFSLLAMIETFFIALPVARIAFADSPNSNTISVNNPQLSDVGFDSSNNNIIYISNVNTSNFKNFGKSVDVVTSTHNNNIRDQNSIRFKGSPLTHIDAASAPLDIFVKFYDPGISFDKVAQLIVNQTSLTHNHTPSESEISLLNGIDNELLNGHNYSTEFSSVSSNISGAGQCNPNSIKTSLETCDTDAAFIHEVCLQSAIGNDTSTCKPNMISDSSIYLQKRGITDPQTDPLAYNRFIDMVQTVNMSKPIVGVIKIDTTKEGALKHFGVQNILQQQQQNQQQRHAQPSPQSPITNTTSPSVASTINPTHFQSFGNSTLDIKLQYPIGWEVTSTIPDNNKQIGTINFTSPSTSTNNHTESPPTAAFFEVNVKSNLNNYTLTNLTKSVISTTKSTHHSNSSIINQSSIN
jgi:hypothetical protein